MKRITYHLHEESRIHKYKLKHSAKGCSRTRYYGKYETLSPSGPWHLLSVRDGEGEGWPPNLADFNLLGEARHMADLAQVISLDDHLLPPCRLPSAS